MGSLTHFSHFLLEWLKVMNMCLCWKRVSREQPIFFSSVETHPLLYDCNREFAQASCWWFALLCRPVYFLVHDMFPSLIQRKKETPDHKTSYDDFNLMYKSHSVHYKSKYDSMKWIYIIIIIIITMADIFVANSL